MRDVLAFEPVDYSAAVAGAPIGAGRRCAACRPAVRRLHAGHRDHGREHHYTPLLEPINVAPQELTRVFLNLIGNGFYAATKRARGDGGKSFQPTLTVATRDLGEVIEVKVRDNGTGIAPEIRDKLFQPFFTSKPTDEGTGLGLSISYDIVTQQHGGTIEVDSEVGEFTEFTVRLPRAQRPMNALAAS